MSEVKAVTFRLDENLVKRLRKAAAREYWPQTAIVARGIHLALQELEAKRKSVEETP